MNDMTFHCKLILDNDQDCAGVVDCLTTHVMSRIYHDRNGQPYSDQRRVRVYFLAQFVRDYVEEITDAGNEYFGRNPMNQELICGALQQIDFREIAEDLIRDYSPKSTEETAESEEYFSIMGFGNYDIDED